MPVEGLEIRKKDGHQILLAVNGTALWRHEGDLVFYMCPLVFINSNVFSGYAMETNATQRVLRKRLHNSVRSNVVAKSF